MAYKTMTLGECAKYDHETGQKARLTRWGMICKFRQEARISRKEVRKIKRAN